jgi:hypothetical protein
MKKIDTSEPKDAYVGFRASRKLARALASLADEKRLTVSQFLRETIARQVTGA